ncbi:MAG: putative serine/threonine-protein kinase Nek3 [Streblomastix strix]|uniref:non-specific serine/threonine protein kinase n=1 Tax=Streblomastix strix TaxID=222440 RepID=A0A5J4UTY9_9EUKA|nr:MAG: putative serine/threonine-protein kinase Nek3 [Streblomastix strix]
MHPKLNPQTDNEIIKRLPYITEKNKKIADEEVSMLNKVQSKFTVKLIDTFTEGLDLCLVLEYCSKGNLRDVIEKRLKQMNVQERMMRGFTYGYRILMGMNILHQQQIVHRDLKPENILFDKDGQVKIADFGLAQKMMSKSYIPAAGTKNYAPPEAYTQNRMNIQSDIWAFGIIFVEIITGVHPFEAQSQEETIKNISSGSFKPLPNYIKGGIRELIEQMFKVDTEKRPSIQKILECDVMQLAAEIDRQKEKKNKEKMLKLNALTEVEKSVVEIARLKLELEQKEEMIADLKRKIPISPKFIIPDEKHGTSYQNKFTHTYSFSVDCTVAIDPVVTDGIVRIDFVFEKQDGYNFMIGVADQSCVFKSGNGPSVDGTVGSDTSILQYPETLN